MVYLLIPGRHQIVTNFQQNYLNDLIGKPLKNWISLDGASFDFPSDEMLDAIVFAVTSANHSGTRRNPLDLSKRTMLIDRCTRDFSVPILQYPIDDIAYSDKFAAYCLKKIEVESQGIYRPTPTNTIVLCSTPEVILQFQKLGYQILPAELIPGTLKFPKYYALKPWEIIEQLVDLERKGEDSLNDRRIISLLSSATRDLLKTYQIPQYLLRLFDDGLLGSDGDLTDTRDYRDYIGAFDLGAERKFQQLKNFILPGKIVDIGCCTGALIEQMTKDTRLRESDFYGIEIARKLYEECKKRKEHGYFSTDTVFFLQKNIVDQPVFDPSTIATFISCSLTHEIYSYQSKAALQKMIGLIAYQLKIGGRWLNIDVVGPENKDQIVLALFSQNDAGEKREKPDALLRSTDYSAYKELLHQYLSSLSTWDLFLCFAEDFRREEGEKVYFEIIEIEGVCYIQTSLKTVCEFMSKKSYTNNWESEMHEKFCDFSFSDWKQLIEQEGFQLHSSSHAYINPRIHEHIWKPAVQLFVQ